MALTTKFDVPLYSATKLNVPPSVVADETGYTGHVNAGAGNWVLGSAMPKGRTLMVVVGTGALSGSPTGLQVALYGSGTDANGTSGAVITSTVNEVLTPAGNSAYTFEIDLAAVTDLTKYYSLGLALKGGGTTTCIAGAVALVLDKTHL